MAAVHLRRPIHATASHPAPSGPSGASRTRSPTASASTATIPRAVAIRVPAAKHGTAPSPPCALAVSSAVRLSPVTPDDTFSVPICTVLPRSLNRLSTSSLPSNVVAAIEAPCSRISEIPLKLPMVAPKPLIEPMFSSAKLLLLVNSTSCVCSTVPALITSVPPFSTTSEPLPVMSRRSASPAARRRQRTRRR